MLRFLGSRTTVLFVIAMTLIPPAFAKGIEPRFDLADPAGSPFPCDRFTVPDASQLTGLRVNLPRPDCSGSTATWR